MKYQALMPQFFSVGRWGVVLVVEWGGYGWGGRVGGGGVGVGRSGGGGMGVMV